MDDLQTRPRQRALSEAVAAARRERALAAPLNERLTQWHHRVATLGGAVNHVILRGLCRDVLRAAIDELIEEVEAGLATWRADIPADASGRVEDAEKSCRSLIGTLAELQGRLAA